MMKDAAVFSNMSLKQREAMYFPSRLIDGQLETPELSNLQEEKQTQE